MRTREIDDETNPEPIPGLPSKLPEGEHILWQGSPGLVSLAIHAFRVRAVAIYFCVIAFWRWASLASSGVSGAEIASTLSAIAIFFVAAMTLLFALAYFMKRETIYTITTHRVVMRFGVALRKTVNIPFRLIGSAALKPQGKGHGDVALSLTGPDRLAYLQMWPHVRPFRYTKAEPTLRAIPEAARVANLLAGAVKSAGNDIALAPATPSRNSNRKPMLVGAAA